MANNGQITATRHGNAATLFIHNRRQITIVHHTICRGIKVRCFVQLRRTTDVECAHRQLCARLTNRLSRNNADRFTNIDRRTACKIATITRGTNTNLGFTDQRAADFQSLQTDFFNRCNHWLVKQSAFCEKDFSICTHDVFSSGPAQHALTERCYSGTTLDNRTHFQRPFGAAIDFNNGAILRHVNQTAGQITRVCCLQRGIGKSLTRTVG